MRLRWHRWYRRPRCNSIMTCIDEKIAGPKFVAKEVSAASHLRLSKRKKKQDRTMSKKVEIQVEGKKLIVSNLEKVLYPETGFTKGQVIDYYIRVAPVLLPHPRGTAGFIQVISSLFAADFHLDCRSLTYRLKAKFTRFSSHQKEPTAPRRQRLQKSPARPLFLDRSDPGTLSHAILCYYALDDRSHSSDLLAPWVFVPRRRSVCAYSLSHCSRRGCDKTRDGTGSLMTGRSR